jgi:predicted enzyme related to lactoylglutathione lyase
MLRGVAVVWMPVQDIDRAKGFYRDTLGLRITNVDGEWAEVDANGLTLGLNGREPSGAQGEGGPSLPSSPRGAWKRPSMASRPRGGGRGPRRYLRAPWGRVATFKDSEGNDIQLYEAPKN